MGLETMNFINDFTTTNPISTDSKSQGDDHIRGIKTAVKAVFPGMTGAAWRVQAKSGSYTVVVSDNMTVINCTAALTLTLTAAATLGSKHMFVVVANGGNVTIDPNSSETLNGSSTSYVLPNGSNIIIFCDGSNFRGLKASSSNDDGAQYYAAGGGSANAHTVTLDPVITAYAVGQSVKFLPTADNTGAATLNVNGLGTKNIKKDIGSGTLADPDAGDLDTVVEADCLYDGTQFLLLNPAPVSHYLLGYKRQVWSWQLNNNGGTLRHRGGRLSDKDNAGSFQDKIVGLSGSYNNTPSISSSVDFVTGLGIKASVTSMMMINIAATQDADIFQCDVSAQYNDTGNDFAMDVRIEGATNINGETHNRPAIRFRNRTTGAAHNLNTTNIPAGDSINIGVTNMYVL